MLVALVYSLVSDYLPITIAFQSSVSLVLQVPARIYFRTRVWAPAMSFALLDTIWHRHAECHHDKRGAQSAALSRLSVASD